jgi:DNA-binding NarL/FixJ family response regulator
MIRIFVVADHVVVRAGVRMVLAGLADMAVVGEAISRADVPEMLAACGADVVVVDPDPAGEDGIALLQRLAQRAPERRFLVLTGAHHVERHRAVLEVGARGLVLKDAPADAIVRAIRRIHCGELWFERSLLASSFIRRATAKQAANLHGGQIAALTEREREIIALIGEGLRNDQIALRLGVADKTVRNHLSVVFNKLGVNDRLGLVVYAYQHGLAHLPALGA